jgi:hypothetical protein
LESVPECNSVPLLIRRCVDVFVTEFREQITNECPNLIENNDIERLRLVFVLLDHTGDISSLTQSLESYIVKQGLDNMIKNKDTIKQVCYFQDNVFFIKKKYYSGCLFRIRKVMFNNY